MSMKKFSVKPSGFGNASMYNHFASLAILALEMSCTIEKALADAKALVERLREHDNAAEALIEQTTALNKRVEAMKQYQEEIQELNEVARHRPRSTLVMGIQQENRQIRELQQENKELRTSLEEHQSALELIMSKYREQMFRLLMASKKDDPSIIMKLKEQHSKELQVHVDQITEMAAVMRKAIEIDEKHGCKEQERIIQLERAEKSIPCNGSKGLLTHLPFRNTEACWENGVQQRAEFGIGHVPGEV
ncbi:hypothetical protein llap_13929 [Limosa lapponica baueri]|uniref:FGFR1 oncogene partner 2 n=1 Tax=Limosa lapponica baueri TaxID=1758121 RepID=A0A2I0TPM5_LIMLA|nr:hypothetical protein llap_13929 [Limosa lapponica baueri]